MFRILLGLLIHGLQFSMSRNTDRNQCLIRMEDIGSPIMVKFTIFSKLENNFKKKNTNSPPKRIPKLFSLPSLSGEKKR